jgi:hypothetical protein
METVLAAGGAAVFCWKAAANGAIPAKVIASRAARMAMRFEVAFRGTNLGSFHWGFYIMVRSAGGK